MNEQPEALRLAEALETGRGYLLSVGRDATAAELRRLHEENERLRDAVAKEREACAKVCEELFQTTPPYMTYAEAAQDCAAAIRARGET